MLVVDGTDLVIHFYMRNRYLPGGASAWSWCDANHPTPNTPPTPSAPLASTPHSTESIFDQLGLLVKHRSLGLRGACDNNKTTAHFTFMARGPSHFSFKIKIKFQR